MFPTVDIGPLFDGGADARAAADTAIAAAASQMGFLAVRNWPGELGAGAEARAKLLTLFELSEQEQRKLWRWNFDSTHPNVYRGWYPLQEGQVSYKEGIDIGPDLLPGHEIIDPSDPLCEPTPLPGEDALPGWRDAARDYYGAMLSIGRELMRSIARGLNLPEQSFDAAFSGGMSTLRITRYPAARQDTATGIAEPAHVEHNGEKLHLIGRSHVDTGFITLLAQTGVAGLQASTRDGRWLDVPPADDGLTVNFGKLLERWTGERIRATEHRVVSYGEERFSIPFFYEPRVNAEISPLPLAGSTQFEPFLYGDHLWAETTKFIEQGGIAHLREPRRNLSTG